MFEPRLFAALTAGSTVVTPNKRLARALVAAYDRMQHANGRKAWPAIRALPWSAWLEHLWGDVLAAGALPSLHRLLREPQVRRCWQQIIAATDTSIANIAGAAELAGQAWTLAKAWGSGGESWRAWRDDALADDDCAIFAGWAERFHATLRDLRAIDEASLADAIAGAAATVSAWRGLDIVLAGFLEPTPQQERLIAALSHNGARIVRSDTIAPEPMPFALASAASPRDEMLMALAWARREALANPGATIGIAVEDLATRRSEVIALADDVLCPALALPGREGETRPYNVSLAPSLASAPLIASALGWIDWAVRPLPLAQAAVLLRSPYWSNAEGQWPGRAALERTWLEEGRREITCNDAAVALARVDELQAERLKRALVAHRLPRDASPKDWVDAWRRWLGAIGWPGDRSLSSAEQQARDAFDELLADFAALAIVDARMRARDAHGALRDLANQTLFQPESPAVPIQIVGLLEATGLPFDRLWIAGLAAHRWPRPAQPHPMLPLAWQREHDVPHATAARELRFARTATAMLLRGAPRVVVSYAQSIDEDQPPRPSELVAERKPAMSGPPAKDVRVAPYAQQIHATGPVLELIADQHAPLLAEGSRIRGGAHAIEAQANCPFQAVALHRLQVERWPAPPVGLTAIERGTLVHAALADFWTDVRDSATLKGLSEMALSERIANATAAARRALTQARWHWVPPIIAAGETTRIAVLLREWIDRYERARPPFVVEANEQKVDLALAGIAFRLRIDRVDRVEGGFAIIDYKTGVTLAPKAWFDSRPRSPQLGLYTLARQQTAPGSPIRAVAYAQLRTGELKVNGVTADRMLWPGRLVPVEQTAVKSWPALEAWWQTHLEALADEMRSGAASVTPRDGVKTCRNCELWALCRVRSIELTDDDTDNG